MSIESASARYGVWGKYSYAWLTFAFFAVALALHWYFGWQAFTDDALDHGQPPRMAAYLAIMARDTFENWQSEFLQLLWQVVGLAYFLYLGSPSSKENDDRLEAKIDALLALQGAGDTIADLDRRYLRHGGHARPFAHPRQPA